MTRTWTFDEIQAVRNDVVAELKLRLLTHIEFVSLASGLSSGPALALRLQIRNDDDKSIVEAAAQAYHDVVAEIIAEDPNHPLASMSVNFAVMGIPQLFESYK